MDILFAFLFFAALIFIIIGIFKPNLALFWLKNNKTRTNSFVIYGVVMVVSLLGVGIYAPDQATNSISATTNKQVAYEQLYSAMPGSEKSFIVIVNKYIPLYKQAPNELKKSALVTKRFNEIKNLMNRSPEFSDWIGTIADMGTNGDGKAYVTIKVADNISMETMNNVLSDIQYNTLISQKLSIFKNLSNLASGDKVKFSGILLGENNTLGQTNITEKGKMLSPRFLVRFTKIEAFN